MSSTVKANKWLHSDGTETTEVDVPSLDQRMAKAWVTFDEVNNVFNPRAGPPGVASNIEGSIIPFGQAAITSHGWPPSALIMEI